MQTLPLAATKMTGSGNDFVVIDNRDGIVAEASLRSLTSAICRRGLGLGADGVILIERPSVDIPDVDFAWRYFNADGSDGELCGNGAMCGARFAVHRGVAPPDCRFSTMSGIVSAQVSPDPSNPVVSIMLGDSGALVQGVPVIIDGEAHDVDVVTVGVPHAVRLVDDVDRFDDQDDFHSYGRTVRQHPVFAPAGVNLNLIHRIDRQTIRMRTYERGVEAETLACGTGAAASAFVAVVRELVSPPVTVVTSSGQPIVVTFEHVGDRARSIRLAGEARFIVSGELHPESWR